MLYFKLVLMPLTPLIMRGQHKAVELRPSSFRGGFRYWTRALIGGEVGNDFTDLQERENEIWGSTSLGSSITIRIGSQQNMLVSSKQTVIPSHLSFEAYAPNRRFELILSTHPLNKALPRMALGGVLLALRLGAFGARARRGGGSLAILEAETNANSENWQAIARLLQRKAPDGESLLQYLQWEIETTRKAIRDSAYFGGQIPDYPILVPDHAKVLVSSKGYETYEDALGIMWQLRIQEPFRSMHIFGDVRPRRASPFHMRVTRTLEKDNPYYPMITIFRSKPNSPKEWSQIQDFIDICKRNSFEEIFGGSTSWR